MRYTFQSVTLSKADCFIQSIEDLNRTKGLLPSPAPQSKQEFSSRLPLNFTCSITSSRFSSRLPLDSNSFLSVQPANLLGQILNSTGLHNSVGHFLKVKLLLSICTSYWFCFSGESWCLQTSPILPQFFFFFVQERKGKTSLKIQNFQFSILYV